ncbi:uncharacterized protein LACBIDRAFT_331500 [Laccaria bicolor S238N-H82]|uniref:Predicted protein n=1 Tax=Laccaria bicolor (strain S238N-H82 / ATCC MYA-4686) TaxID=486041 RepID=B0DPN4_LACBS|nr:uncharacterized protein LACBIDRAFT_331500 [Laccaria bicolor S238N-H82]EDR03481.1 predicted protein [Laccaria bicolor S238N-H82]|eukprot:XP_001885937.1 predicted protein [Laccaria bicolor S238N-H82]
MTVVIDLDKQELTHNVLIYLDSDDVARMARVGNTFQAEAERLLSRRRTNWEKSLRKPDMYRCGLGVDVDPTTKYSGQGSRLVQELIFWYSHEDNLDSNTLDMLVIDQLCEGLLLMTSLKHLTIRLPGKPEFEVLEAINSTLARCTFSLKTLYLPEHFELFPWILNQPELKIIAVYTWNYIWGFDKDKHLSCQRWLSNSPCFRNSPTFFILSRRDQEMNVISAFLTFSPQWSAKLINDSLERFYEIPRNITKLGLYVQTMDELDDRNVLSVIRSISDHFVNIDSLDLFVGDCMIHLVRLPSILSPLLAASIDDFAQKNPEALASVLSCLTGEFQQLEIQFWERPSNRKDNPLAYSFHYQKLKLCKIWSERCPSLAYIGFPDYTGREIDLGWKTGVIF